MRLTPHKRLLAAISVIKVIVFAGILGAREPAWDVRLQNRRKPCRCQRNSVSGLTIRTASFQARTRLASSTSRERSLLVKRGRFTLRLRTMRCWRSKAFSAISSSRIGYGSRPAYDLRASLDRVEDGKHVGLKDYTNRVKAEIELSVHR